MEIKLDNQDVVQKLNTNEKQIKKLLYEIPEFLSKNDFNSALNNLEESKKLSSDAAVNYYYEGMIKYCMGEYSEAEQSYMYAILHGYITYDVLFQLGTTYFDLGKINNAIEYYSRAESLDATRSGAVVRKAEIYLMQESYEKALIYAKKILNKWPENSDGYHLYLMASLYTDSIENNINIINQALQKFPTDPDILFDLVVFYDFVNMPEEALKYLNMYFGDESKYKDTVKVRKTKAKLLLKSGFIDEFEEIANEILEDYFDNEIAELLMIETLKQEKFENALKQIINIELNTDIEKNEYFLEVPYYKGYIFSKLNDKENMDLYVKQADEFYKKLCSEYASNFELYVFRCLNHIIMKDFEAALKEINYVMIITNEKLMDAFYIRSIINDLSGKKEEALLDKERAEGFNMNLSYKIVL